LKFSLPKISPVMRCTLLSRFEGAFLGANQGMLRSLIKPGLTTGEERLPEQALSLLPLCQSWCEELIHGYPVVIRAPALSSDSPQNQAVVALGCTIPLAVYFHDQPQQLQQLLEATLNPLLPEIFVSALALVHGGIAIILRGGCLPEQLIPEVLTSLDLPPTGLIKGLIQAQSLQADFVSLEQARAVIAPLDSVESAISVGFYLYLSSPNDFRLTLMRAIRGSQYCPLTAMVAGALSGAHNGAADIPARWRSPTDQALSNLANQLLAAWSGVDSPWNHLGSPLPVSTPIKKPL
jgi:hypothetical protein